MEGYYKLVQNLAGVILVYVESALVSSAAGFDFVPGEFEARLLRCFSR
jgi:hypothetical protein